MNMLVFFFINEKFFFAWGCADYGNQICFMYEIQKVELGKSLGYYGESWFHCVFIYTCNACGYKYHIIKNSHFAFRDKKLDPK